MKVENCIIKNENIKRVDDVPQWFMTFWGKFCVKKNIQSGYLGPNSVGIEEFTRKTIQLFGRLVHLHQSGSISIGN